MIVEGSYHLNHHHSIRLMHEKGVAIPIVVGGAVLTEAYAEKIGADYYARDAKATADIARKIIG